MPLTTHRNRKLPEQTNYDVVVVGSGLGGLTCAALLARLGLTVLVVEAHDRPGGYAHSFQRHGCTFDAAVHLIGGCKRRSHGLTGFVTGILQAIGEKSGCAFASVSPFYTASFPGWSHSALTGDDFIESYAQSFPRYRDKLALFLQLCREAAAELYVWLDAAPCDVRSRVSNPKQSKYRSATLGAVLDSFFEEPRLKAALSATWLYYGIPPEKLSFMMWAAGILSYVDSGAYYCLGSFQNLADSLVSGLHALGGEIVYKHRVTRLVASAGRITGILLDNGSEIGVKQVVWNGHPQAALSALTSRSTETADLLNRIQEMDPCLGGLIIYGAARPATREALCHETFCFPDLNHSDTYSEIVRGEATAFTVSCPSVSDPSLAPNGDVLFSIAAPIPAGISLNWQREKQAHCERLLARARAAIPSLFGNIRHLELASPSTLERYTLNPQGAMYGWQLVPRQTLEGNISQISPVPGLYLCGHWTDCGPGAYGVMASGFHAARLLAGFRNSSDLWKALYSKA